MAGVVMVVKVESVVAAVVVPPAAKGVGPERRLRHHVVVERADALKREAQPLLAGLVVHEDARVERPDELVDALLT